MGKIIQLKYSLSYYLNLFDTRLGERDYLGALDAGRSAINYSKTRIDKQSINLLLSQAYFEMGLNVLSCEYAFRAVKIPETRANAYFCIGKNLVKLKRYSLAVKYFAQVLDWGREENLVGAVLEWCHCIREEMMKNSAKIDVFAAIRALIKQKKYDQALEEILPNLQNNDLNYQVIYCDILVQKGECNQAREILREILRFDRENVGALLVLANISLIDDDFISLEKNLEKLQNLSLSNGELETVANIYAKCGNYAKAIENYQKILKNDEFNTKILLFMAICYYNLQNHKEALYYLGRARWIDIENPTLNIFYEIINGNQEQNLQISTSIPQKTGQEKMNFIYETINLQNFEGIFETSLCLANDIEWCLTLKNTHFTPQIAQKIANSRSKSIISFYNKLLLTLRIGSRQKFYLTKYALSVGALKSVDFTHNMHYHSFKFRIPSYLASNQTLRQGYCGAVAYAEISNLSVNLDKINQKLKGKTLENIDFPFTENLISCLYFCENKQILEQACIYFDTPKNEVEKAIKCLNLL